MTPSVMITKIGMWDTPKVASSKVLLNELVDFHYIEFEEFSMKSEPIVTPIEKIPYLIRSTLK